MPPPPQFLTEAEENPGIHEFVDFLREISQTLLECGCSSNRLELLVTKLGTSWKFEVEAMALPTGVWLAVRSPTERLLDLTRIKSWSVDLDKLVRLNDLVDLIEDHRISIADARKRLKEISTAKKPYPWFLSVLAGGGSSLGLVYFYNGSPIDLAVALPAGILVQLLQRYSFSSENRRYLVDFICSAGTATFVLLANQFFPALDVAKVTVGGLISMVPGLILVNSVHEIAQKNLVSGTAKFIEAMVVAASLVFGVVFVFGIFLFFRSN